ncbi:MAG TPA: glycosyltransferase [Thermomicrobiales bacterium]|jgi:D-inositol-3-phosphate glycosyltransferase|nr:glycosyltransferase [Thermomicrobiales bacterium]
MSDQLPPLAYRGPAVSGYDIDPPLSRIGMISLHTSPLAPLGSQDAGGMNLYVRELARHLARQGRIVDIYTRRTDPHTPTVIVDVPGVNVIHLTAGPAGRVPKTELYALTDEFADAMLAYMVANGLRYSAIHAHYWLSGVAAARVKDATGTPFVQMFHTTAFHKNAANDRAHHESQLRERVESRLLNIADAVIAGNPDEREDLAARRNANDGMVCMIPLGVDLDRFVPGETAVARQDAGLPTDGPLMLFVGRIDPIKGLDILIDALHRVARGWVGATPPPRLVLVGGELDGAGDPVGPLATVATQIDEMGLRDYVILLGSRDQQELATLYQAVDFVVIPSRYESFGLVAVEAMASGTPVIASRAGGLPWSVRDGVAGLLVPPANTLALTDAILELTLNVGRRERLAARARVEAARFSWDTVATAMSGVYRIIAARTHTPICVA